MAATHQLLLHQNDDSSISMNTIVNRVIMQPNDNKEYIVKILFCPSMGNDNTEVAHTWQTLIELPKLKSYDQYL